MYVCVCMLHYTLELQYIYMHCNCMCTMYILYLYWNAIVYSELHGLLMHIIDMYIYMYIYVMWNDELRMYYRMNGVKSLVLELARSG